MPLFKKGKSIFDKTNYGPVSLLCHVSKTFERINYNQISDYINFFLSKLRTWFYKNHNRQHSLLKMLESFKDASDKVISVSATFIYLSKCLIA